MHPLTIIRILCSRSHEHGEKTRFQKDGMAGEGSMLLSYTTLNLFDTERDKRKYDDIRKGVMDLPFLNLHRIPGGSKTSLRLEKIQDYLASAKVCVESNLQWCLMMEEYSVVPRNFLNSLQRFVTAPMESLAVAHSTTQQADIFLAKKFSIISLFSSFDWKSRTPLAVHNPEYSKQLYNSDRGKLNSELKSMDSERYHAEYHMHPHSSVDYVKSKGESDVALLFTSFNVKDKLIPFLKNLEKEELSRISSWQSGWKYDSRDLGLNLELEFVEYTGVKQYQLEPSLVNRIGFYDEDLSSYKSDCKHHLGISNWYTDPRFLFEEGDYREGVDLYCQTKDGAWYYDYNYYNYDKESSCESKK